MRHFMHRAASVATGTLAILGMASCGATDIASTGDDRVIPLVSISLEGAIGTEGDTVSVRTPLQVRIQASDNAAILLAIVPLFAVAVVFAGLAFLAALRMVHLAKSTPIAAFASE